ncbi:MAG: biopolymer transporter Tol [Calditrichia bacterium]
MKYRFIVLFLMLVFSANQLFAQNFGKNKIQYKNFEWYFIQSKHFDIYYYPGGKELAEFTAEVAEEAYQQLKRDFSYELRERVVIITYNSHNDWQQTNVVISYLEEGVGGVTELYKNRVVVPFEGSYEQFRHVIHHELVHAVMNDMLYGGSVQSLIMGEVIPLPLWVSEGLAEFESSGWNTNTDMIVRDAVLTGYMPPIQYLEYILAYQGGNSVFRYIAETYGREKIGEILNKSRGRISFQQILKSAVGLDYKEFDERWHRWLKKQYWPAVSDRLVPKEFSRQLTDHEEQKNFLNVSPAITPQGDKIAYISDRDGYQNIYLMSAIDGKEIKVLLKGQRSESFEELHFLRPGMSFSPDGKKLAFTAKSGPWDAIYIVDVESNEIEKHLMQMDGAFTTSWSPDGKKIAFVGNNHGQSDIYLFDVETDKVEPVTNDVFTDDEPSWSADSKNLVFVSDRGDYTDDKNLPADFDMSKYNFQHRDIYTINLATHKMVRKTNTPWEESYPKFSPDGTKLAFTSDENGIFNVYIQDLQSGEYHPITNIITGVLQIGWDKDANKMVYTTFYKGGFDIFMMSNPLEAKPLELKNTQYADEMRQIKPPVYAVNWKPDSTAKTVKQEKKDTPPEVKGEQPADYSNYVFGRYRPKTMEKTARDIELPEKASKDSTGSYRARKYKLKFSPDFVTGAAGYNTFFGLQGYTSFAFSDLLGDHKILLNLNLWADLRNSDFTLLYYYLKHRINLGFGGYHLVYLFQDSFYGVVRYRNFGTVVTASYPLSRYNRFDLSALWYNVYLEYLDFELPTEKVSTVLPELSFVHDNVLWGFQWGVFSPVSGSRYSITARFSPKYNNRARDFQTIEFDYRKYFKLSQQYQFAFRTTAGASFGKNSQQFFLGGMDNWINRSFAGGRRIDRIDDVFFSEFITPLRGTSYYERIGDRFFLTNMEFRFPLIEYLKIGFPPLTLFNIRGVAFYDIGSAWYNHSSDWWSLSGFRATQKNQNGKTVFKDIASGYGTGARIYFLGFLLRFDVAWPFDLQSSGKPVYYWSLGLDF